MKSIDLSKDVFGADKREYTTTRASKNEFVYVKKMRLGLRNTSNRIVLFSISFVLKHKVQVCISSLRVRFFSPSIL